MDAAQTLLSKIFSLVDLQKKSADRLNELAAELKTRRQAANKAQVKGSVFSVFGAAALTAAGVCTGGAAVLPLAVAGQAASWLGLVTNVSSEIYNATKSSRAMNEGGKISEEIEKVEREIQELVEQLAEGQEAGACRDAPEDYVMEQILRAMARCKGLDLNENVSVLKMVSDCSKEKSSAPGPSILLPVKVSLTCLLGANLVWIATKKTSKRIGKEVFYRVASSVSSVSSDLSSVASASSGESLKLVAVTGSNASAKAFKYIAGGAVGLLFSVPELIINSVKLKNCETDDSKSLREKAEVMWTASENMKKHLENIEQTLEMLAEVKRCIENSSRSCEEEKKLIEFAIRMCEDEDVLEWLMGHSVSEDSESESMESESMESESMESESSESRLQAFSELVDMFNFLKRELNKAKKKTACEENIDITFVAHGAIEETMISASSLLPLPTIEDVVLYSPWNCAIDADVAYGVATGIIKPHQRVFSCIKKRGCLIPDEGHQPTKLPNHWNSMKEAGGRMIPKIIVSTLRKPQDGAWTKFQKLESECGVPGRNRVVIPFILPEWISFPLPVPFSVITLALSLVLFFSCHKATVHLAACLSKRSGTRLCEDDLKEQYACTINNTAMKTSEEMLQKCKIHTDLYRDLKAVFAETSPL